MTVSRSHRQATLLGALAQGSRLRILERLATAGPEGLAAGEIARSLGCPGSTLSFHVKELSRNGLVDARPSGRFVIYCLRRPVLRDLALYVAGLAGQARDRRRPGDGSRRSRRGHRDDANQLAMFAD